MAAGALRGGGDYFAIEGSPNRDFQSPDPTAPIGLEDTLGRLAGSFTQQRPTATRSLSLPGAKRKSLFEDFYNRVYLIPGVVDFGAVALQTEKLFYIWNAHFTETTLTQVGSLDPAGTAINGIEAPYTYKPLQLSSYQAVALEDGPAKFSASYTFLFDTDEAPKLILLGERARLLPFYPNWRESYKITYEHKTEIIVSRSGREQRRQLRQRPREGIEFTGSARTRIQVQAFNRHLEVWQNRATLVPEETKFLRVEADESEFHSVFSVGAIPLWAIVGQPVMARNAGLTEQFITEIKSIVGTSVELAGSVPFAMPAGSMIMLARTGRIRDELAATRETNTVVETEIAFDVNPGSGFNIIEPAFPVVVAGREVLTVRPNWKDTPSMTFIRPRETLDYGVGRTQVFTPIDFSSKTFDYLFSGLADADVVAIVGLFKRMAGRCNEFYMPSWQDDLIPYATMTAGTRSLTIYGDEVYNTFVGTTVNKGVMVMTADGRLIPNVFAQDVALDPDGNSLLTFALDWPETIAVGSARMVSWLYAMRFDTDKLVVEWLTREVAKIKTSLRTLEDLPE